MLICLIFDKIYIVCCVPLYYREAALNLSVLYKALFPFRLTSFYICVTIMSRPPSDVGSVTLGINQLFLTQLLHTSQNYSEHQHISLPPPVNDGMCRDG